MGMLSEKAGSASKGRFDVGRGLRLVELAMQEGKAKPRNLPLLLGKPT